MIFLYGRWLGCCHHVGLGVAQCHHGVWRDVHERCARPAERERVWYHHVSVAVGVVYVHRHAVAGHCQRVIVGEVSARCQLNPGHSTVFPEHQLPVFVDVRLVRLVVRREDALPVVGHGEHVCLCGHGLAVAPRLVEVGAEVEHRHKSDGALQRVYESVVIAYGRANHHRAVVLQRVGRDGGATVGHVDGHEVEVFNARWQRVDKDVIVWFVVAFLAERVVRVSRIVDIGNVGVRNLVVAAVNLYERNVKSAGLELYLHVDRVGKTVFHLPYQCVVAVFVSRRVSDASAEADAVNRSLNVLDVVVAGIESTVVCRRVGRACAYGYLLPGGQLGQVELHVVARHTEL